MNFSASPLSSHCTREPMLARRVSPPSMYSTTSTGSSTNISSRLTGIFNALFSVCSDMATGTRLLEQRSNLATKDASENASLTDVRLQLTKAGLPKALHSLHDLSLQLAEPYSKEKWLAQKSFFNTRARMYTPPACARHVFPILSTCTLHIVVHSLSIPIT